MQTADRRRDRGSMAVELVILAPVMMAFIVLVVACGRYVAVRGDIEAASRDAARAASLERSRDAAERAADGVAAAALEHPERCQAVELTGDFVAGGTITATVTCDVSYEGLGLIGIPGSKRLTASSSAPLDTYRRTG
ncbi:TadE family protein [Kribbella solani]|uniref:Flp pilus assembly protein TadG n=1 Tax=Kribbella solani TaxID=236067 RepID=A0A841DTB8_9ACTN|nr:TadE/TadG family type IV pilus assembly protein [Kribbella solani]MBB5979996.1 Flp pilus assembly protein TadG [Kribbella solani]MDX2973709.1 pilus assembly protein [Kribbella solani]MDX3007070.1 pilus assembly protein [Kribbella solani]